MHKVVAVVHRIGQMLTDIVDARLPMSVWLDFAGLDLYKKRPQRV
jgi:hypothetical protein